MPSESRAYDRLKALHPRAHWQRFEGWSTIGVFDSQGCQDGIESWVENKQTTRPRLFATPISCHKVRGSQVAWEAARRRAGGRTFVGLMLDSDLFLLPGWLLLPLWRGISIETLMRTRIQPSRLFDPSLELRPSQEDMMLLSDRTLIKHGPRS